MWRNGRILVAMSGGVDSSVAAALLREQGHDVVGVFMRLGTEPVADACATSLPVVSMRPERTRGCCSASDAADARAVAGRLGIPFYALNFRADFQRLIDDFADEYVRGRTPNPCVRCNQWLKFGRLVAYADTVDAEWIATGHYARVSHDDGTTRLFRAADERKDQSYVLFGVSRDVLARTMFPLGGLTKEQVREQARRLGLTVHDKPDSQDICFVPDGDYARIVASRRPAALRPGEIRHVQDSRVVGHHAGVATLTVGQRRGLDVALGERVYVTSLDAESATAWVGPRESLAASGLIATEVNWLNAVRAPGEAIRADVQIRYHHRAAAALVETIGDDAVRVSFDSPVEAVTPGQAAVFYRGDEVLGGGWISSANVETSKNRNVETHGAGFRNYSDDR